MIDPSCAPSDGLSSDETIQPVEKVLGEQTVEAPKVALKKVRRRRQRRTNWMLLWPFIGFCCLYLFYVFALPEIETLVHQWRFPKKPTSIGMKWWDRNLLKTCEFLFIAWFFYFGASIGSFLNVVAWRMPEGRTIVFGGSKCPCCNTRLSFLDNTPVLGWLSLQGRCRTCKLPIAPRYLLIEIAVGAAFVWFALWELIRGGANLPHWPVDPYVGLVATVFDPNWPLIGIYFGHGFLFAILIMLATANQGKKAFPFMPILVMGIFICWTKFLSPSSDFVPWTAPFSIELPPLKFLPPRLIPLIIPTLSIVLGGLAGALLGLIFSGIACYRKDPIIRWHWALQCFLIGAVLGWQSAVTIVIVSLIAQSSLKTIGSFIGNHTQEEARRSMFPSVCLILVAAVHHSFWIQITRLLGIS